MFRKIDPIRLRLLILTSLLIVTAYTAMPQRAASACIRCVSLTGGLCVGCESGVNNGGNYCWPVQENCSCTQWGQCDLIIE